MGYRARELNEREKVTADKMKNAVGFVNGNRNPQIIKPDLKFDKNGKIILGGKK